MTEKKSSNKGILIIIALVFVVLLAGILYTSKTQQAPQVPVTAENTTPPAAAITPMPEAQPPQPGAPAPVAAAPAAPVTIDVAAALSDRILGDTNAKLKISEHASLTCSHCGEFHKDTFDLVKKNYIDTGKAYLIFSDFPLNAPALKAGMVARCLPKDKYFDFIHLLYSRQEEWAYSPSYIDWLKARAAENGMDEATFTACINSKELEDGITDRMKAVSEQWHINSTPSFVLDNKVTISGAYPYDLFSKALDSEITGKPVPGAPAPVAPQQPQPAPAAAPPATPPPQE